LGGFLILEKNQEERRILQETSYEKYYADLGKDLRKFRKFSECGPMFVIEPNN